MVGNIHSIETFGTVDGPGIRFVVFLQGCPMRCRYCHNPDTWNPADAQHRLDADEVFARMKRNLPFYRTGGITVSGGEPLCQMEFVTELFTLAHKEGIHTALDTSGAGFSHSAEYLKRLDALLSVTDLVMLDIKHMNEDAHVALTSRTGTEAKDLARYLSDNGKAIRIRYVLVPGITDGEDDLCALGAFAATLPTLEKIEILPYHRLGEVKYKRLGIPYTLSDVQPPSEADVARAERIITAARGN